jgi:hypothetical protein
VVDVQGEADLQKDLYHYTDFVGLKGIYEQGEIWATNSQYLNDISEMQLGPEAIIAAIFINALPKPQQVSQIQKDLDELKSIQTALGDEEFKRSVRAEDSHARAKFRRLAKDLHISSEGARGFRAAREVYHEIMDACEVALEDTTCFVFSLSKQPDQLSQWRAYARDGVCIEFSAEALREYLKSAPALRARMQSVTYYDGETIPPEAFSNPIISWADERRTQLIADSFDQDSRKAVIGQEMMTHVAFLKDIHFSEEEEVRIAVQGNPNHFTTHRYGMVPRMKLPITSDAIRSVIVGPSAHSELRVQSLRTYFDNWGFKNEPHGSSGHIRVDKSSIPYRDW